MYSGLGSSTRKSLQMGYADMCINGKPAYRPVENFSVTITSRLQASSGVGFIGMCLIQGRFSVVVGKCRWLTL